MIVKRLESPPKYRYGGQRAYNSSKYRYGGNGIFSNILKRTLTTENVKNLINTVSKSKVAHKAANAVVNGAANALKTTTQKGIESMVNNRRRSKEQDKKIKTLIERLGKGIVRD